jgi:hypothetical protein
MFYAKDLFPENRPLAVAAFISPIVLEIQFPFSSLYGVCLK